MSRTEIANVPCAAGDWPQIYDGQTVFLDVHRKKNKRFWKHRTGRLCSVISCNHGSAIVAILALNELVICRTDELLPAPRPAQ